MVSIASGQGYFKFLYKHTKCNIHNREGGGKENKKYGLRLAPSARREKFVTLLCSFLCICELSQACIRAKFQHYYSRWPNRPLGPQVLAVAFFWPLASPNFCRLLSHPDCPVLFTAFFCQLRFSACLLLFCLGPCLPSSSSGLVGDLTRKPFVWVSPQNRQRNPMTGTHPHHTPTTNAQNRDTVFGKLSNNASREQGLNKLSHSRKLNWKLIYFLGQDIWSVLLQKKSRYFVGIHSALNKAQKVSQNRFNVRAPRSK